VEIGAALGLVPNTVAPHIRRVRAVLRKALKKWGGSP
jgi:DNA-directed RNA polymerase specialized sigma24 family protein